MNKSMIRMGIFSASVLSSIVLHLWVNAFMEQPEKPEALIIWVFAFLTLGAIFGLLTKEKPWLWAFGLFLGNISYSIPMLYKSMASTMSYYQSGGFFLGAIGEALWIGQQFLWCFIPAFIGSIVAVQVRRIFE